MLPSAYPARNREEIRIRDPFVYPHIPTQTYYIYASMPVTRVDGSETRGVGAYTSQDLKTWSGPEPVYSFSKDIWANNQIWAPEMHPYQGKFYLFAAFSSTEELPTPPKRPTNIMRQMQILVGDSPAGPFRPFRNDRGHTPEDWMSLDGTFWEEDGLPYMIFCHEWRQITDGSIDLMPLKQDLSDRAGEPETLFYASQAPWIRSIDEVGVYDHHGWVSNGPFLYRTTGGKLLMIWSSYGDQLYAIAIARSNSGSVHGPWAQQEDLLFPNNGGHGMIFRSFGGKLILTFHQPNSSELERAQFYTLEDTGDTLILGERIPFNRGIDE